MNNLTAETRRRRIVEALEHEGNVQVEHLADRFSVSQVTIRKDLAELEEQGLLQRTYGGAVYSHRSRFNFSFFEKLKLHSEKKEWIAEAALNYIHEGDTLFMDSGSTTLALAKALPGRFRSLYIITSSVPAALELSKAAYEILLVGGQVRNHSLALIGPVAVKTISQYHADRAFLGTSGISLTHGHSTPNPFDAEVKQAMIRSADESYVLTDSSKFGHTCLTIFASLEEVHLTITDNEISPEFHKALGKRNIGLQIIDPEGKIPDSKSATSPAETASNSGPL